jgi:putative transposase
MRSARPPGEPSLLAVETTINPGCRGSECARRRQPGLGLIMFKSPVRAPKANAFSERLIVTLRRECLDWLIPLSENHLRRMLARWVRHYNKARPHSSLGPKIPGPPPGLPVPLQLHRHRLPKGAWVAATPILGGLHHEYRLDTAA